MDKKPSAPFQSKQPYCVTIMTESDTTQVNDAKHAAGLTSTWDTDAFKQAVVGKDWKEDSTAPAVTKLQDLSLGGMDESNHSIKQIYKKNKSEKTWPFEEPCAWNGGKNTRPTQEAEHINKEYFNPDFVDHRAFDVSDHKNQYKAKPPKQGESVQTKNATIDTKDLADDGDDGSSSSCSSRNNNSSSSSATNSDIESSSSDSDSSDGASFGGGDSDDHDDMLTESPPKKRSDSKPTPNKNHTNTNATTRLVQQPLPKDDAINTNSMRSTGYNSMLAWNRRDSDESMEKDGLSISDDGSHSQNHEQRRGQRRPSTTSEGKRKDPLQVPSPQTSSSRMQRGFSKRNLKEDSQPKGPEQSRSSSNRYLVKPKDQLSSSCHAQSENIRIRKRSSRKGDELSSKVHEVCSTAVASSSSKLDDGRRLARTKSSDGAELAGVTRKDLGTTIHGCSLVSRIRSTNKRSSTTGNISRRSSSIKQEPRRGVVKRAMSTRNIKPPEEYAHGLDTSSHHSSSLHKSKSVSGRSRMHRTEIVRGVVPPEQTPRLSESTGVPESRGRQSRSTIGNAGMSSTPLPPRRDLLLLLREKKKITKTDFLDKENRRLLHFLMYEHKMGVPHAVLVQQFQAEQEDTGERPIRKMDYPSLFIDAGI